MADAVTLTSMVMCQGGTFQMGTPLNKLDQIEQLYQIPYRDLFTPETPQHEQSQRDQRITNQRYISRHRRPPETIIEATENEQAEKTYVLPDAAPRTTPPAVI